MDAKDRPISDSSLELNKASLEMPNENIWNRNVHFQHTFLNMTTVFSIEIVVLVTFQRCVRSN